MLKYFPSAILMALISASIACKGKLPWIELNDGNKIPMLGLGTDINDGSENNDVEKAVEAAISSGYRLIDTAEYYKNEAQVGKAIQNKIKDGTIKRENIFVITKLWNLHHAKHLVEPTLKDSLNRLGLSYVDMYLIHFPVEIFDNNTTGDTDYMETWQAMEECKERGLTKSIGVSNFNETQIHRIIKLGKVKPAVNQIEVHPTLTQKKLVKYCKDHDVDVIAYSPLGSIPDSKKNNDSPPPKIDDPKLTEIANKYGKSTVQIVLRYAIDRGLIPIPRASSEKHIKDNFDVFDFCLSSEDVKEIDGFDKDNRLFAALEFKNHKYYPFQ